MRITLHEFDRETRKRNPLLQPGTDPARLPPYLAVNESSDLTLRVYPEGASDLDLRVWVGNVLVASTRPADRPDFRIRPDHWSDAEGDCLVCSGRLLRDWVG